MSPVNETNFSVVLLGTGTPLPSAERACASTLAQIGDKSFLVDTGRGFLSRLAASGLNDVSAVLFTHFHSDHFGEFGELMVNRSIWGATRPLPVIGPTGTKALIDKLLGVYALDNSFRKQHHGDKWAENGVRADVIEAKSGIVYDSDGIKITMFPVSHPPVAPAVGYRFEYSGERVVISGDTVKLPVMAEMAKGADILVHEAANRTLVMAGVAFLRSTANERNERQAKMAEEMLTYHATTEEVAEIAARADVKKLVLTHLVPSIPANENAEKNFIKGMDEIYKGQIIVGRDLMRINVRD